MTRDVLGLPEDTVLGDPGLLLPIFHRPKKTASTKGKIICVRHTHDTRNEQELLAKSGADIILSPVVESNLESLKELIDNIVSADFVLTASLHAAIVAAAYGRPFAYWDNGILDIEFKWRDFSSSIGIETNFFKNVSDGQFFYDNKVKPFIKLPSLFKVLEVCPFYIKPSYLLKAAVFDGELDDDKVIVAIDFLEKSEVYNISNINNSVIESSLYRARISSLKTFLERTLGRYYEGLKFLIRTIARIK